MMVDDAVTMAEYLGIDHRYIDGTMTGGSSFEFHVQHAAAAIRDGLCDTLLVTYGSDQLTRMGRTLGTGELPPGRTSACPGRCQFEAPYGNSLVGAYAMVAQRHMHEFGTTSEQLAEIAVGVREFACAQPAGPLPGSDRPSTTSSAAGWSPTRCTCSTAASITDGGGALLMTTDERARDLKQPPVYVLGAAGAQTHWNISPVPGLHDVGRRAASAPTPSPRPA